MQGYPLTPTKLMLGPRWKPARGLKTMTAAQVRAARSAAYRASARARAGRGFGLRRNLGRARALYRTGGFTGIERKFYDVSLASTAIPSPADATGAELDPSATLCLTTIAQGDGEQNRDGRNCVVQSIYVNGVIRCAPQANQTATDTPAKIYVAMVLDTQTNGAQLNSEDVFTNPSASGTLAANPLRNLQYSQRFRVLSKFECVMPHPNIAFDGTNIEQQGSVKEFQLSWRGALKCQYTGTTSDIANQADNSVHIIAYCSDTGQVPTLFYNARTRFVG